MGQPTPPTPPFISNAIVSDQLRKIESRGKFDLFCRWLRKKSLTLLVRLFLKMFPLLHGTQAHIMEAYTIGNIDLNILFIHIFVSFIFLLLMS